MTTLETALREKSQFVIEVDDKGQAAHPKRIGDVLIDEIRQSMDEGGNLAQPMPEGKEFIGFISEIAFAEIPNKTMDEKGNTVQFAIYECFSFVLDKRLNPAQLLKKLKDFSLEHASRQLRYIANAQKNPKK